MVRDPYATFFKIHNSCFRYITPFTISKFETLNKFTILSNLTALTYDSASEHADFNNRAGLKQ